MTIDVFTMDGAPAGRVAVTARGPRTVFEYTGPESGGVMRLTLLGGGEARSLGIPAPEGGELRLRRTLTRLELGTLDLSGARAILTDPGADMASLAAWEPAAPEAEVPAPEPASEPEPVPEPEPTCTPEPEPAPEPAAQPEPAPESAPEPPESETPAEPVPALTPAAEEGWYLEPDPARHLSDPELRASAARAGEAWVRFEGADTLLAFPWSPSQPFPMIEMIRLGAAEAMAGREFMVFRLRDGTPV